MDSKTLFVIVFFSTFTLFGQNIKGTVLEEDTNLPIENVNVYFKKEKIGTATDETGGYDLKIKTKIKTTDTIRFSIIGYAPKNYTYLKLEELHFTVHLSKQTEKLNEVTVTSKRELNLRISFKKLASMPKGVYDFGSVVINNKIYVVGGNESYYDNNAQRMFNKVATAQESTFEDLFRGARTNSYWENYNNNLQIYDIEKDAWTVSNLKFHARAYHNINFVKNKLYILGGKTLSTSKNMEYLDDKIEVFDLNTGQLVIDNFNSH